VAANSTVPTEGDQPTALRPNLFYYRHKPTLLPGLAQNVRRGVPPNTEAEDPGTRVEGAQNDAASSQTQALRIGDRR
jgi:hypothetical protein